MTDRTISLKVREETADTLDQLADNHDMTRSALLRTLIQHGWDAHTSNPDDYPL